MAVEYSQLSGVKGGTDMLKLLRGIIRGLKYIRYGLKLGIHFEFILNLFICDTWTFGDPIHRRSPRERVVESLEDLECSAP